MGDGSQMYCAAVGTACVTVGSGCVGGSSTAGAHAARMREITIILKNVYIFWADMR
jgi:hypothetical protein